MSALPLIDASEKHLTALARNGHQTAWNKLVQRYRDSVVALLPCSHDLAEDLVQDALERLLRDVSKLQPTGSFAGMLYRRALWDLQDHWRTQKRRRLKEKQELPVKNAPSDPASDIHLRVRLQRAQEALSEAERPAWRHYIWGGSAKEYAREQGVTEGAYYTRVFRAKQRLRAELEEDPGRSL